MSVAVTDARLVERVRTVEAAEDPAGRLVVFAVASLLLGVGFGGRAPLFAADVFVAVAAIRTLAGARPRRLLPTNAWHWCCSALAAAWVLSLAVHPSPVGVVTTLRYACLAITIPAFGRMLRTQPGFVGAILSGVAIFESSIVLLQGLLGHRVGLGILESPTPFRSYGGRALAPLGTIHHADLHGWLLASIGATLILLALRGRFPLTSAAAVLAFGVAAAVASYRRVTILEWAGLGLTLVVVAATDPTRRRRAVTLAAAMLLGGLAVTPHSLAGWTDRADIIQQADTPFDSGRSALLPQAGALLRSAPVTGVGPVQYLPALVRRYPNASSTIIHVVPILLVVEGGALVGLGLLAVGLAAAIGLRRRRTQLTLRGSFLSVGLATPLVVMSLLTPLPTMYAIGPLLTALSLAVVGEALLRDA